MKNILKLFLVFSLLLSSASFVMAADGDDNAASGSGTVFDGVGMEGGLAALHDDLEGTGIPRESKIIAIIIFWIKVFLVLAGILAFVAFVWAGFLYITTFVSEENPEKAKKIMLYAILGILVIIFSYAIVSYFMNIGG